MCFRDFFVNATSSSVYSWHIVIGAVRYMEGSPLIRLFGIRLTTDIGVFSVYYRLTPVIAELFPQPFTKSVLILSRTLFAAKSIELIHQVPFSSTSAYSSAAAYSLSSLLINYSSSLAPFSWLTRSVLSGPSSNTVSSRLSAIPCLGNFSLVMTKVAINPRIDHPSPM